MAFNIKRFKLGLSCWCVVAGSAIAVGCGGDQGWAVTNPPADTAKATQPTTPPPPPPPQPTAHSGYFVAANGSSSADGSQARPWDLATAVSGGGGRVHPGDTVWVRAGTYYAPFRTTFTGTAAQPIVLRAYPGERAVIDGVNTTSDNFVVQGSYTVIWGLEFTNTASSRYTSDINHDYRADLVVNKASHTKYVNLIAHDGGAGFYNYSSETDVEVYGGVFYNLGWQAPDRGHGHALYLKADVGPMVARDNVVFNQYGYGIHVYSNAGDGLLNNIRLEGNVSFDNGSLASTGTSANLGNLGVMPANNLAFTGNMTYMAPTLSGANVTVGSGSGLTLTNNYVVGGDGMTQDSWTGNVLRSANTVLAAGRSSQAPTVFVRPNVYEAGRAMVVIYNPSEQGGVAVNLGGVLNAGDRFEVRNVQDLRGTPVTSGTYDGGMVNVPMGGVTPPTPIGLSSSQAPRTGPGFDVFIVTKL